MGCGEGAEWGLAAATFARSADSDVGLGRACYETLHGGVEESMNPRHVHTLDACSIHDRLVVQWTPSISQDNPQMFAGRWFLLGRFGTTNSATIVAIWGSPFVIGRANGLDLVLRSPMVSRRHVEIVDLGDKLQIADLSSRNGTFVDGQRVKGSVIVESEAVLRIANMVLELGYHPGEDAI